MRRLPSSASSNDSTISERWPVSRVFDDHTLASDLDLQFGDVPVGLGKMPLHAPSVSFTSTLEGPLPA
jgi:hypothetical protein